MKTRSIASWAAALLVGSGGWLPAAEPLDAYLREGNIQQGLTDYAQPADDGERFSLAVLQVLDGVQKFSAGMNRYELNPETMGEIPFFRVVRPGDGGIERVPATPAGVAEQFRALRAAFQRANQTLAQVGESEFGVEVNLSQVRLDFDGNGEATDGEVFVPVLENFVGRGRRNAGEGDIVIRFDSADAAWLKGYTHFLGGVLDLLTAYDWKPVWNQMAHALFANPDPMPGIAKVASGNEVGLWADLVAGVHDMRLKPVDPDGVRRARDEFRAMIACSRICWQRVLAETDDDHEWLPSPNQKGPRGATITQQDIDAWRVVLDELDAISSGRKLLPHWRLASGMGINVEKLVASPPELDLVLIVQGSALLPYIEKGEVSDRARWRELMRAFDRNFGVFAIWSN